MGRPRKCWIDGLRVATEKKEDSLSPIEESQKYLYRQGMVRIFKESYQPTDNLVYLLGRVMRKWEENQVK